MAYSFLKISTIGSHNSLESEDGGGGHGTHLFSRDFSPGFGEILLESVQIWHRCGTGLGFQNGPNAKVHGIEISELGGHISLPQNPGKMSMHHC